MSESNIEKAIEKVIEIPLTQDEETMTKYIESVEVEDDEQEIVAEVMDILFNSIQIEDDESTPVENEESSVISDEEYESLQLQETNDGKRDGLTEVEKAIVREKHPDWPDEIIDAICSWKEYEVLDKANLKLEYINGRPCLIRTDIDMEQKDAKGRTNRERMEKGLAPIGSDGKPINLHHIGQRTDSPLAELTTTEHQENDHDLHPYQGATEVHGEGNNWQTERENHWVTRSKQN
ncbi:MAG: endonuclease VII [Oscillospiraceae bacterium]|nr:endonuclease VII [Oscillospiraceae bacterium]